MITDSVTPGKNASDTLTPIDPLSVRTIALSPGVEMPVAAYGTFHSDWAQDRMLEATVEAIRLGWRHLDTARAYENEAVVGEAIREAIRRGYIDSADDLFITGKLWNGHMHPADVAPALDSTLSALGLEKIDLYLNHWPWPNVHTPGCTGEHRNPDAVPYVHEAFMETWGEICRLKQAGKIVHIGLSNHTPQTLKLLLRDVSLQERPVVNQMELHPLFQQTELVRSFQRAGLVCTGYMAVGSPKRPERDRFPEHQSDLEHPIVQAIAQETGLTAGQVCLAWAAQREDRTCGYVVMTTTPARMVENLLPATTDLLTTSQMERLATIDADNRLIQGQVFLWPEAKGDWRVLWDDSQVYETWAAYDAARSPRQRTTT